MHPRSFRTSIEGDVTTAKARRGRKDSRSEFVSAVLLAAGLSSRFGRPKQLAELEGEALVRRAVWTLERSPVNEVIVVVGHRAADVVGAFGRTRAKIVYNERYKLGPGSSLKAGLSALSGESRALLVCLADQPFVTPRLIGTIVSRHVKTGADVVASFSDGHVSPPVIFSWRLYGEIANIPDGTGAKAIIENHPGFEKVGVKRGTLLDVDTEEDLEKARKTLSHDSVRKVTKAREAGAV